MSQKQIGPELPPYLKNQQLSDLEMRHEEVLSETVILDEKTELYGPKLPPHLINAQKYEASDDPKLFYTSDNTSRANGCRLFTECTELSEDDECYGPLPPNMASHAKAHIALEERALQMKINSLQEGVKDQVAREQWMIELPEVHSRNLGLGPRQFRAKSTPDMSDRSSWTDTPQDKIKKPQDKHVKKDDLKKEAQTKERKKYDQEQEKIIKKHRKHKQEESLLDMHQRNMSKKRKEEECTRRPFNREIDLKVNCFDEAQKKSILRKAQLLDDRFSSGQSKFL